MNSLSREELRDLILGGSGHCVSIYMPTHRSGPPLRQDPIRFKNLLRRAEELLVDNDMRATEASRLMAPGYRLQDDSEFWRHQGDGLAFYLSEGFLRHYCLPASFEEQALVMDHFHIKPLLPLLSLDGHFYVLALSQNSVRLLRGTRFEASHVDLKDVPRSLAEALQLDTMEKQLQFHTGAPVTSGMRAALFHGHGAGDEDAKERIRQYFRRIDRGLREHLREERVPLILAGVEYLFPIYREANTYPCLMEQGLPGNPETVPLEELRTKAWDIAAPHYLREQTKALARYRELAGTGESSNDLSRIVPAAYHGRIDSLFVAPEIQRWGNFDSSSNAVSVHPKAAPGDQELLNFAAVHTFMNGGDVYALDPANSPGPGPLAAIFRY